VLKTDVGKILGKKPTTNIGNKALDPTALPPSIYMIKAGDAQTLMEHIRSI
jgi:hypothetical protein